MESNRGSPGGSRGNVVGGTPKRRPHSWHSSGASPSKNKKRRSF
ncbi:hypothetical protein GWI33_006945, partial [Rhynchophorus ferrugineus]